MWVEPSHPCRASALITGAPRKLHQPSHSEDTVRRLVCSCQRKSSENQTTFPAFRTFLGLLDLINCIGSAKEEPGRLSAGEDRAFSMPDATVSSFSFIIKWEEVCLHLGCSERRLVQRSAQRCVGYLVPTLLFSHLTAPTLLWLPYSIQDFAAGVQ